MVLIMSKRDANKLIKRLEDLQAKLTPKKHHRTKLPWPLFNTLHQLEHTKRRMLALPIWRKSKILPIGYKHDPNNVYWLLPDEYAFKCLLQSKRYLAEGYTFKEVADWLTMDCKVKCHPNTLQKVMGQCRPLDLIAEMTQDERERLFQSSAFDYYNWGEERERFWQKKEGEALLKKEEREAQKRALEANLSEGYAEGRIPSCSPTKKYQ